MYVRLHIIRNIFFYKRTRHSVSGTLQVDSEPPFSSEIHSLYELSLLNTIVEKRFRVLQGGGGGTRLVRVYEIIYQKVLPAGLAWLG